MDSTFLTLPPPYDKVPPPSPPVLVEPTSEDPPRLKRCRSPSFLSSVRSLIPRPLKRSRSPASLKVPKSADRPTFEDLSNPSSHASSPSSLRSRHSHCCLHTGSCQASCLEPAHEQARKKSTHVPSMVDYLTLEQLETIWRGQDTYKGTVDAPRTTNDLNWAGQSLSAEIETRPQQSRSGPLTPRRHHSSEQIAASRWYAGVNR